MTKVNTVITKVAKNKKVIRVEAKKDPKAWWILNDDVHKFINRDNSPVYAGITADIEYEEKEGDIYVSRINVIKSDKPAEANSKGKDSYKENSRGDPVGKSIERQCALKSACNVASGNFDVNNAEVTANAIVLMAEKFAKFIANKE